MSGQVVVDSFSSTKSNFWQESTEGYLSDHFGLAGWLLWFEWLDQ
jgi:hypothetical protein